MASDNAIVVGIVDDLNDPEGLGRVRVRYPNYDDQRSNWARIATPMAGRDRGLRYAPEKGDEVLVAHEQGDKRRPYILGALWSSSDPPPSDDGDPVANNLRQIVSRSGHRITLDDTAGAEKVDVVDSSGRLHVVLDSSGPVIRIVNDTGDIAIEAPAGTVAISALTLDLHATSTVNMRADGVLTVNGATVQIN